MPEPTKIVIGFMGTPDLAKEILEHILTKSSSTHPLPDGTSYTFEIGAVWTNPPRPSGRGLELKKSPVQSFAEEHQLPCYPRSSLDQFDLKLLEKHRINLIFTVAYGVILSEQFFSAPSFGGFNLHFSLLPKYRGASPLQQAILNGDSEGGITYQTIRKKVDSGAIILQKSIALPFLSFSEYLQSCLDISKESFTNFLEQVILEKQGKVKFEEQSLDQVTHAQKISKEDGQIQANDSLEIIYRKYLAYQGWPGIHLRYQGEKGEENCQLTSLETPKKVNPSEFSNFPQITDSAPLILTNLGKELYLIKDNSVLKIEKIKKTGKKEISALDFINGSRLSFPYQLKF